MRKGFKLDIIDRQLESLRNSHRFIIDAIEELEAERRAIENGDNDEDQLGHQDTGGQASPVVHLHAAAAGPAV